MKLTNSQTVVSWEAAAAACTAAAHGAEKLGIKVDVAVVDAAGNLAAYLHMPGAFLHSADIAKNKAYSAASFGLPTSAWTKELESLSPAVRVGLPLQPRMTCFGGGLPIRVDGQLVGGIGVSGGTEQQDEELAKAALAAAGIAG